jgi:protein tyrosine phosphatase
MDTAELRARWPCNECVASAGHDVNGVSKEMIEIKQSKTADTRSCDFAKVTKETLRESSVQHINDVRKGLEFFAAKVVDAMYLHDHDKLSDIDGFHRDFITGFKQTTWWDNHRKVNRHHLLNEDGVPSDVNLIDVLDMIVDCVMAGMGRTGTVYPLDIKPEVLMTAFQNTAELLKSQVVVILK